MINVIHGQISISSLVIIDVIFYGEKSEIPT